jgi:hypothetical protein
MILAIILLFVICWGPLLIDNVLTSFGVLPELHYGSLKPIRKTFAILAYSNSCVNPIVYAFMSKNFRSSFVSTLQSLARGAACFGGWMVRRTRNNNNMRTSSWRQDSLRCRTTSFPVSLRDSSNSLQGGESRQKCCMVEQEEEEEAHRVVVIGNKQVADLD